MRTFDLLEHYELMPPKIAKIMNKLGESPSYKQLGKALYDCQKNGYTFNYYLDAIPYGLTRIHARLTKKLSKI